MISKISKGHGFSGLLSYVSAKSGAEFVAGNVSENPKQAAREMGALRQYSTCKTPVWHCSLSLSPKDRHLTDEEFAQLAEKFLRKMGIENNQYCVWRHNDTEHPHIHIVVNRIGIDGNHNIWNSWQDIRRAREAKLQLELEYGLQKVPYAPQFGKPEIPRGQAEEARRIGKIPDKKYIAEAILSATARGNVRDFVRTLKANGIEVIPNISKSGRMNGFSFTFGRKHYKGSQLRCSWAELSKRLNYEPQKDNDFLYSLLPTEKQPSRAAEPKEPRPQYCIYTAKEWELMGGAKNSNYRRAYRMINEGYSIRDVAQELRLQNPSMTEEQLKKILKRTGEFWIQNNRQKLEWAYNTRRRSIRFSNDPMIMLLQVLALLISAAIKASLKNIEEHQTAKRLESLSVELREMANYAENKALQRREQAYEREREREERENPLLRHAREISLERSR